MTNIQRRGDGFLKDLEDYAKKLLSRIEKLKVKGKKDIKSKQEDLIAVAKSHRQACAFTKDEINQCLDKITMSKEWKANTFVLKKKGQTIAPKVDALYNESDSLIKGHQFIFMTEMKIFDSLNCFLSLVQEVSTKVSEKKLINLGIPGDKTMYDDSGCCHLGDESMVVADYRNSRLKLVDPSSSKVTKFCDTEKQPWDVCGIGSEEIAQATASPPVQTNKFLFASPVSSTSPSMAVPFSVAPKRKPKTKGPASLDETAVVDTKLPTELKIVRVMDILGKSFMSSTISPRTQSSQPTQSGQLSLSSMFKASGWSCDVCLIKNKETDEKCAACRTPKPAKSSSGSGPISTTSVSGTSFSSHSTFKQTTPAGGSATSSFRRFGTTPSKSTTWTCNTCLIKNTGEATVCAACNTSKPAAKSGFKPNNETLGDKCKPAAGQWNCEVCLVQNKSDISTWLTCPTPIPSKPFKHPSGDWTCDTCLVSNKEKYLTCTACTHARPGPPRTQTVPSCAKSYSLSQAGEKSDITVTKGGGFIFGGSSVSSKSDSTTTGFSFGASSSENKSSEPVVGGFKFGESRSSTGGFKFSGSTIDSNANATPSTGGFKFGALSSASIASIGTGFTFGAPTSSEATSTVLVGGFKLCVPSSSTPSFESKKSQSSFGSGTGLKSSTSSENKTGSEANTLRLETNTIGGFKFGASVVASDKKPETASIENKTSEASVKTGFNGFQFGKPSDSSISSLLSSSVSSANSNSLTSGLSFAKTAPTSDAFRTTTLVPGGFSFGGTSHTATSSVGLSTATTTQSGTPPASIGGFSFIASYESNTSSTGSGFTFGGAEPGGFTFGGAEANITQGSSKQESKSSIGGFTFGQKPPEGSTSTTEPLTGFNFTQKTSPSDQSTTESTATKGSREEGGSATTAFSSFGSTASKSTTWTCDICLIKNTEEATVCFACGTSKPAAKSGFKPNNETLGDKFKPVAGQWNCEVCLVQNKSDISTCVACQTPKPSKPFKHPSGDWTCDTCLVSKKEKDVTCTACTHARPGPPRTQTGGSATTALGSFGSNASKSTTWTCDICLIKNTEEATVCFACSTSKPAAKSGFKPNNITLGDKFKPAAGQWNCEVCLVQNKSDIPTCVACQTPKPSKPFKHSSGDWTCDTCLVSNKEKDVTCIACTQARSGPPRT